MPLSPAAYYKVTRYACRPVFAPDQQPRTESINRRMLHQSAGTSLRNWQSGMYQIAEGRVSSYISGEIDYQLRDRAVMAGSMARDRNACTGTRAEGVVERSANAFGRQALADILRKELCNARLIYGFGQSSGAGKVVVCFVPEARSMHDPFVPLQV